MKKATSYRPVIGRELLALPKSDASAQFLDDVLAIQLAEALKVLHGQLASPPSLNDVSFSYLDQPGNPQLRKVYNRLLCLLKSPDLPVPDALKQLVDITDLKLFLSLGFDNLLAQAIDQRRFGGEERTSSIAYAANSSKSFSMKAETGSRTGKGSH